MELTILGITLGGITLFIIAVLAYVWGWNTAVRRFGRRTKAMEGTIESMRVQHADDPRRFDIDTGKTYVTTRIRDTLDDIDREMT